MSDLAFQNRNPYIHPINSPLEAHILLLHDCNQVLRLFRQQCRSELGVRRPHQASIDTCKPETLPLLIKKEASLFAGV